MRYRIESRGGPTAAYWTFSDARHVFKPGDALEYDVRIKSRRPGVGGIDISTTHSMRLRDFNPKDQNGLAAGPKSDLSSAAYGKWYHRKIVIPAELIGEETAEWLVTASGIYDTGEQVEAACNNVCITNKGRKALSIYDGGQLPMNQISFANEVTLAGLFSLAPFSAKRSAPLWTGSIAHCPSTSMSVCTRSHTISRRSSGYPPARLSSRSRAPYSSRGEWRSGGRMICKTSTASFLHMI